MDIIQRYIRTPLSGEDLKRMIGKHAINTRIMTYHELAGKTAAHLFSGNIKFIILYEDIHEKNAPPIGHWVALLDHGDHYEHFDSYGIGIDEEEIITHETSGLLTRMFREAKKPLVESGRKLQSEKADVNTCGRWVVARIHLGEYELPKFYQFVDMIHQPSDVSVTLLTMFLS